MSIWVLLIIWLASYFLAKKSGMSSGAAALTATGVTAGANGLYNVANGKDFFSFGATTSNADVAAGEIATADTTQSSIGRLGSQVVSTTGDVLKSWGPTGTAAVVGTTALASSGDLKKYLPWIIGIGAAVLILK